MKKTILFLLFVLFCSQLYANDILCEDDQTKTIIKNLNGSDDISKIKHDMNLLTQKPYQAVGCLLKELNVVKEIKIAPEDFDKHKSTLHVIWCIRTLRYLTGMDFKGQTNYKFKKKEEARRHVLTLESEKELPFFSTTMSHEVIYIAPRDAQQAIIEKWMKWYALNGKDFIYKTVEEFDKWFY